MVPVAAWTLLPWISSCWPASIHGTLTGPAGFTLGSGLHCGLPCSSADPDWLLGRLYSVFYNTLGAPCFTVACSLLLGSLALQIPSWILTSGLYRGVAHGAP